jgi:hypothetical protein
MKLTLRIVALLLCSLLVFSCATAPRVDSDDPFSAQLDREYAARQNSGDWMLGCAISLVSFVIGGTIVTTLYNTNNVNQGTAIPLLVTSYTLSLASGGLGIYEFVRYKNSFNDYLETLRLQTQYNNAIQWTKKSTDQE